MHILSAWNVKSWMFLGNQNILGTNQFLWTWSKALQRCSLCNVTNRRAQPRMYTHTHTFTVFSFSSQRTQYYRVLHHASWIAVGAVTVVDFKCSWAEGDHKIHYCRMYARFVSGCSSWLEFELCKCVCLWMCVCFIWFSAVWCALTSNIEGTKKN